MDSIDIATTKELGSYAEHIVCYYLEKKGYIIVDANFSRPWGEIDIICLKEELFIFVEVKANKKDFGSYYRPEFRVNDQKTCKIIKTATLYMLYEADSPQSPWQVDVVAVVFDQRNNKAKITHYKNVASNIQ